MLRHVSAEIKNVCFQIQRDDVGVRNLVTRDGSQAIFDMGGRREKRGKSS